MEEWYWEPGPVSPRQGHLHTQTEEQLFHGGLEEGFRAHTHLSCLPSPAHLVLKPGIPPLEVHSFGLEYKCPSEEMNFALSVPSLAQSTSYVSAGCQGLCHSMEQLASTSCAPRGCALCSVWLCKDGLASCEGVMGAEREEQGEHPACVPLSLLWKVGYIITLVCILQKGEIEAQGGGSLKHVCAT